MDSDHTSTNTVYHTISQFNISDIETPDELADSEPSPSTFSHPLSTTPYHIPNEPSSAPSSYTDATPITSDPPDPPSPVDEELENELDSFVTLEQHLQNPNTLKIHHLSQTITSSESSNQASTTEETRAHRVIKRKHPNTPIFPNSRPPQTFSVHPLHTNKK